MMNNFLLLEILLLRKQSSLLQFRDKKILHSQLRNELWIRRLKKRKEKVENAPYISVRRQVGQLLLQLLKLKLHIIVLFLDVGLVARTLCKH
jgi:hypothetical protein